MGDNRLVPWREVNTWSCNACGNCCQGYRVPLKMEEFVKVSNTYGQNVLDYGMGKVYLKMRSDRRCIFQRPLMGRWLCTIQGMKPTACRLFPFQIHHRPVYSKGDNSWYRYGDKMLYIYLDPDCEGIISGQPNERFSKQILPEIINSGLGLATKQKFTTSKFIKWTPP
ncbi:YkgJ family cysteine cluster protein [Candidatus Bathyarchaeota archaeon]|nr:YkgJ family cysteine cluster protein [Candidatus Bathyarchaeota archaeon]